MALQLAVVTSHYRTSLFHCFHWFYYLPRDFPCGPVVKNLPANARDTGLLTKKICLKVELFYLVEIFKTPSLGNSLSVALKKKMLQGGRRGSQAINTLYTSLPQRESEHQRSRIKWTEHSMYGKIQASGLTLFIAFTCTSAIRGQSCFLVHLASWIPPAPQHSPRRLAASSG